MHEEGQNIQSERKYFDKMFNEAAIDVGRIKAILEYCSPAGKSGERLPRLKTTLLKILGDVTNARVLICGCGNDNAALWFANKGAIVDVIDISSSAIRNQKLIAASLNLNIKAIVMDAHHLDFPSNEYDIVYGNAILHHLSLDKISKEIYRVLKPGGKAAFREVIKGNIFLQLFRRLTPFWRTPDEHPLVKEDIVLFENIFSKCQIETYMLCGLLYSFFLRMANYFLKKLSPKIIIPEIKLFYSAFDKIDGILFRFMPLLKDQAWLCLIMLRK